MRFELEAGKFRSRRVAICRFCAGELLFSEPVAVAQPDRLKPLKLPLSGR